MESKNILSAIYAAGGKPDVMVVSESEWAIAKKHGLAKVEDGKNYVHAIRWHEAIIAKPLKGEPMTHLREQLVRWWKETNGTGYEACSKCWNKMPDLCTWHSARLDDLERLIATREAEGQE